MGKIKRGNREIIIKSRRGDIEKHYLVPTTKQILVQENDYVKAGDALSDGSIAPADILRILGPTKVQEYIVNEVQAVYRMQGVKINDKHFEVIVRQMMRKVQVVDPGDTRFLPEQLVDRQEFFKQNDELWDKMVVLDAGDSKNLRPGQIVTVRTLKDENSILKRQALKTVTARNPVPATADQILQGITRAALKTSSFMSAASFQDTLVCIELTPYFLNHLLCSPSYGSHSQSTEQEGQHGSDEDSNKNLRVHQVNVEPGHEVRESGIVKSLLAVNAQRLDI